MEWSGYGVDGVEWSGVEWSGVGSGWASVMAEVGGGIGSDDDGGGGDGGDGDGTHDGNERRRKEIITRQFE